MSESFGLGSAFEPPERDGGPEESVLPSVCQIGGSPLFIGTLLGSRLQLAPRQGAEHAERTVGFCFYGLVAIVFENQGCLDAGGCRQPWLSSTD